MPALIATLVAAKAATLNELQTVYGIRDAIDLLEILLVDNENKNRVAQKSSRSR